GSAASVSPLPMITHRAVGRSVANCIAIAGSATTAELVSNTVTKIPVTQTRKTLDLCCNATFGKRGGSCRWGGVFEAGHGRRGLRARPAPFWEAPRCGEIERRNGAGTVGVADAPSSLAPRAA